jgi:hypothetical protein
MPETVIFDAAGDEVFDDELEHGQTYFDEGGNAYVYDETGEFADEFGVNDGEYEEENSYESELAGVGKAFTMPNFRGAAQGVKSGYGQARAGQMSPTTSGSVRAGQDVFRNRRKLAVAGGVGGAGAAFGGGRMSKSLGNAVYEELSKALDQGERDVVISKAMDLVAQADRRANEAVMIAKSMQDERDLYEFVEIAKSYELPGDPVELGRILKSAAAVLSQDELSYLDQVLTAAGEQALYAELGSGGNHQASNIMDEVYAIAGQTVGKFDGVSSEQAVVAMFEANPAAYDEYLSER